ncbi:transcription antitermination factor NusB [Candidatus Vallotia tarda]|uniref:Transcription antitermination protein NusB n=1 Tax=Candidatus Vallotiella hemipterorum TaxID=1177213 RepID=A0A916NFB7_9BURK|nr:transcription antitermination factor NusB [Candidatus Vallotia tarda]CAG7597882.1 N utilization substance protein B homolog [Candidatus Vallotia tarda]
MTTKNARRRSRELATQGVYQWLLSGASESKIDAAMREQPGFNKADCNHFSSLLYGVIQKAKTLTKALIPFLDRPFYQLSPVEQAVLLIAVYEFQNHIDIPYRVVINEAVELTKTFGGSDGYKYINGVLDKLVVTIRFNEVKNRI